MVVPPTENEDHGSTLAQASGREIAQQSGNAVSDTSQGVQTNQEGSENTHQNHKSNAFLSDFTKESEPDFPSNNDQELDFRMIDPRNEAEERIIQQALSATRADFRIRTGVFPAPTTRGESYCAQVNSILDNFTIYWNNSNQPPNSRILELVMSVDTWKGGFEGWIRAPGGDILESLVEAGRQGALGVRHGQTSQQRFWRKFFSSG